MIAMKPHTPRSRGRWFPALPLLPLLALTLAACSGGGDGDTPAPAPGTPRPPLDCKEYNAILPGFNGDLNAPGPIADGGNDGPAGGDAGSAGAGGGLGKVLGAKVEVVRLSDGSSLNNGADVRTDPVTGLFTIRTCALSEPLLITLKGVEGASYFDEGKNALLPFGPDQELHALVAGIDGNIGVSALTEAAYRYAINNFLGALPKTTAGPDFLLKKADPAAVAKLTRAQILAANQKVMDEINRVLPANYRLDNLTALPTPVGTDNQSGSLFPQNRYGQAAIVTGAFSWMADKFRLGTEKPALAILEEFSRDLTDGRLDGFALDGTVASASAGATYDSSNIPITLNVGANAIADSFSGASLDAASKFVDVTNFLEENSCDSYDYRVALTKFGTLDVRKQRFAECLPAGNPAREDAFIAAAGPGIKEVLNSQYSGGGFFVKSDGQVFSWGNSECGQIANGKSTGIQPMPQPIAGLKNITSLASGYFFSVARDNDGRVFSWGANGNGSLGLGPNPPLNASCANQQNAASSLPRPVPGLSDIATVHAHEDRAFALAKDGRLYNWGGDCGRAGGGTAHASPVPVPDLPPVRAFAANTRGCFALKTDGTLIGWGFYNGINHNGTVYVDGQWFGDGQDSAKVKPTPLPGLTDVREIASDAYFFYALKADGTVWRWGSAPGMPAMKTPAPVTGLPEASPGVKPLIRHIKSYTDGARLFTHDGRIFQAKPWADGPAHMIDLVEIFGFK